MNPLRALTKLGQSIWIDGLSDDIRRRIDEDGLRGMTSNPTIFEKAITSDPRYDARIRELAQRGKSVAEILDTIMIEDIVAATDQFRPLFDKLGRRDGFVSLEVSPQLAYDTLGTIDEARRLWRAVDRPNVMIKVPATEAGIPAIEALTADGINVNITLLFGLDRYDEVARAFIAGLESRARRSRPLEIASVASFFLSRIDTMVDPTIPERLRGQAAIASARLAYQRFKNHFSKSRFGVLQAQGAHPQRLLWASTSTKNPAYGDLHYVEPLIGDATINTLPVKTIDAYRDHGRPELRLERELDRAESTMRDLAAAGVDLNAVTDRLEHEGVRKFTESYDKLIAAVEHKREATRGEASASV
jgi:transaldolase/transaldolase/glucose-6-phosphate isomerase